MSHTIVLLQANAKPQSRQYSDFESETKAMDGICQIFEAKLKSEQPMTKQITYDISDLFAFIDGLTDLAAMVYDPRTAQYQPHNKQWIKDRVFTHLKQQAAGGAAMEQQR